MRNYFDMQMKNLHQELKEMGGLCQLTISKTYQLLNKGDRDVIKSIVAQEDQINQKERDIESLCMKLLLRQQPVASDLRKISAALKMITDMERIGDQALDIAEIVEMGKILEVKDTELLGKMAEVTMDMVSRSVEAYVAQDLQRAQDVIDSDDLVDNLFVEIRKKLIDSIEDNNMDEEQILDYLMIAKYYERIGDHATNIAEWVEFSILGKHRSGKEA
ncbi:MAG: phosphate signaling complex protein PhoU [Ruminococcus sp.]|jgi:phosphate transport system protein